MILFTKSALFIHNPKTAGTSLLKLLSEVLPGQVFRAGVAELGTHHPHLSEAQEYANRLSGFGDSGSLILAVVREPLDRERSMYLYFRNVLANSPTIDIDLPDQLMRQAVDQAANLSFAAWIRWQASEFGHCDLWQSQRYYRTDDGRCPANLSILRFDQLQKDLAPLINRLGLAMPDVPRLNTTERSSADLRLAEHDIDLIRVSYGWMRHLPDTAFACGRNTLGDAAAGVLTG